MKTKRKIIGVLEAFRTNRLAVTDKYTTEFLEDDIEPRVSRGKIESGNVHGLDDANIIEVN